LISAWPRQIPRMGRFAVDCPVRNLKLRAVQLRIDLGSRMAVRSIPGWIDIGSPAWEKDTRQSVQNRPERLCPKRSTARGYTTLAETVRSVLPRADGYPDQRPPAVSHRAAMTRRQWTGGPEGWCLKHHSTRPSSAFMAIHRRNRKVSRTSSCRNSRMLSTRVRKFGATWSLRFWLCVVTTHSLQRPRLLCQTATGCLVLVSRSRSRPDC
jgi:hypothetical protein